MSLKKLALLKILTVIGIFAISNEGYCQSDKVYNAFYEKFNPVIMDYNPHFEYSLHKEDKKMLWKDDGYNLEDEYGNKFNSKYLIDLANYDKGRVIIILLLQFTNKTAAKRYYKESLEEKTSSSVEVRLLRDGFDVAIITKQIL